MSKASREKGKRGEREAAQFLRDKGYSSARRGVQYHGGPDSPDVDGIPGIHVEVKRVESLRLYDALQQSKDDSAEDEIPIVMHRKNSKQWVVILDAEDFFNMMKANDNA